MKKYLSALMTLGICMAIAAPAALAQSAAQTPSGATKKADKPSAKKTPAKKSAPAKIPDNPADEGEPDVANSTSDEYQCELGNQLTIYHNAADDKHIGLRWNKQLFRLTRVGTSTGANRFENRKYGLIWINIPSKGLLLDSKKGQQLANDCKTKEQMVPKS